MTWRRDGFVLFELGCCAYFRDDGVSFSHSLLRVKQRPEILFLASNSSHHVGVASNPVTVGVVFVNVSLDSVNGSAVSAC